jgi:hypothetical protein
LLATAAVAAAALPPPSPASAAAAADAAQQQDGGAGPASEAPPSSYYADERQAYRLLPPPGWELRQKAGADALWEDPARRSSSLGVTVSPVRVASLAAFGPLGAVGERLLGAERAKESTLSVAMLSQAERVSPAAGSSSASPPSGEGSEGSGSGGGGAATAPPPAVVRYYCYEYDLESTRGRKRILNVVTIAGSRLYIVNGQVKCGKAAAAAAAEEGGEARAGAGAEEAAAACVLDDGAAGALAELRASAASFEVVLRPKS